MASRSLTEVFILMRNNTIQNKRIFSANSHSADDKMSLVPLNDADSEIPPLHGRIPPEWVNMVEEIHYEMTRINSKLKELRELQTRHTMRPSFDDEGGSKEEKDIEAKTHELTTMLSHCQRLIQHIQRSNEDKLSENVVRSLLQSLQQIMNELRSSQAAYLKRVQNREDNYQQYFEAFSTETTAAAPLSPTISATPAAMAGIMDALPALERGEQPLSMAQLQMLEDNTAIVEQRELEILHITKSIVELNQLFKDLATIVVEQGTVVDRIDYNIEQSNVRVRSALTSVKKAEKYQRKNRKMMAIIVLAIVATLLLVLLIATKL